MARKFFEMAEDGGGIGCEDVAGKSADSDVGFQKFGMVVRDGFLIGCHDAVIAAGERAGPGFTGAELFVMLENLTRQREQGMKRFAMREAGSSEHLDARFFESEDEAGGEGARCMVERFLFGSDVYRDASKCARDGASHADGGGVAFDGEDLAFERRSADTIESLQRVHGCGESAERPHSLQSAGVAGAAGVENDFAAELLAADASELSGNFADSVVGDTQQDYFGGESMMSDARERPAGANKFGGFAGGGFGTRGDNEYTPAAFVQQAPERASYAPGTENGQGLQHPC